MLPELAASDPTATRQQHCSTKRIQEALINNVILTRDIEQLLAPPGAELANEVGQLRVEQRLAAEVERDARLRHRRHPTLGLVVLLQQQDDDVTTRVPRVLRLCTKTHSLRHTKVVDDT